MIQRFLVQYKTQTGAWADASTIEGDSAFFNTREAASEYLRRQDIDYEFIRIVVLSGEA